MKSNSLENNNCTIDASSLDHVQDQGSAGKGKKKGKRGVRNSDWKEDEQNLGEQLLQEFADFQSSRSHRISESDGSVGSDKMEFNKLSDGAAQSQVASLPDSGTSSKVPCDNPTNDLDNTSENVPCVGVSGSKALQQQIDKNLVMESELGPQTAAGSPNNLNSHNISASPCRNESDMNSKVPEENAIGNHCQNIIMAGEQTQPLDGSLPGQERSKDIQNNLDMMSVMPGNPSIKSNTIAGLSQDIPGTTENNPMPKDTENPPLTVRSTTVPGLIQNPRTSHNYEQQQAPSDYYTLTELTPVNPTQLTYEPYPVIQNYPYYYEQNTIPAVPPPYIQPHPNNQWGPTPVNNVNSIPFNDGSSNTWQHPTQVVETGFSNSGAEKPEVPPTTQGASESQLNNCTTFTLAPEVKENLNQGQLVTLGSGNFFLLTYCIRVS